MDNSKIRDVVENNYNLKINSIEKFRGSYKVEAQDGTYAIKIINYELSHFKFILSAINHLQKRGFNTIPEIISTKSDTQYILLEERYAYLTKWIPSRVSNYDNPLELSSISRKLGELHNCSSGFNLTRDMKPRIGWHSWMKVFNTRCNEILDFKNRINQKAYKSEFDYIYLRSIDEEIHRGYRAIEGLKNSKYLTLMDKEIMKRGFCHHDYAHHNILVDKKGELNIIDFDYCILDTHLHDLSSLLIRVMKYGKWSSEKADLIINNYCITNDVKDDEFKVMKYFIMFPQSFWQIGLQYYWEQQPWEEEFFINKINKYIDDIDDREEFLDEYFRQWR